MDFQRRKKIRLSGYDYSQNGAYFITICTKNRRKLLWEPVGATLAAYCACWPGGPLFRNEPLRKSIRVINRPNNRPTLSEKGVLADNAIKEIPNRYPGVVIDIYTVMPNHVHMIIFITNCDENGRLIIAPTVSVIVQQMKQHVTKQAGVPIWQKSFHDHIIRNEEEYQEIWRYINENPLKWQEDCYYI